MKHFLLVALVAAFSLSITAPVAQAGGKIQRACIKADRKAATRNLCSCIQDVADQILSRSDQRKAAKFFKDPQKAQDTRQSDNASNEAFWQRYKKFGVTAKSYCS